MNSSVIKIFQKFLSLLLITVLLIGNSGAGFFVAYADDSATPLEIQEQSPSTPISLSTITTGDSVAVGTQEVTANKTETAVEGSLSVDGCSVDVTVGCPVNLNNDATVEGKVTVDSTSGGNAILDVPGDALEKTGSASALAISQTELNTTVIELTGPTGASGATGASGEAGPTGASGSIAIENTANLNTEVTGEAVSGQNTEKNIGGNAVIATGGSCASAYSLNIINTTILGSNVRFLVINIDSEQVGDINLNELWKEIQNQQSDKKTFYLDSNGTMVDITNSSSSFTRLAVSAISGDNTIDGAGGDGTIVTGDAYASAGLVNFQNTTIIESQLLVVIINIIGTLKGDIIVPSEERFVEDAVQHTTSGLSGMSQTAVSDTANVSGSKASVVADTGNNISIGPSQEQYTQTGGAYAQANEFIVANIQMYVDYLYKILFNNYGNHQGGMDGLTDPEQIDPTAPYTSSTFTVADGSDSFSALESGSGGTKMMITNAADSSFDVDVLARTGGNTALDVNGKTTIKTGTAVAIANILSFFNTTIFGNSLLFPIINLFGSWVGNFVFERPDVTVTAIASEGPVLPGTEVEYQISYVNNTGEEARDVAVTVSLPPDLSFVSTSAPFSPEASGNTYRFPIGIVGGRSGASFLVRVRIASTVTPDETKPVTFFQKLKKKIIPVVFAAEKEKFEIVNVAISTSDTESNSKNNEASIQTRVTIPEAAVTVQSETTAAYDVKLDIASANNAGDFVYPGETIHFSVTLTNSGASLAKDVTVTQTLQGQDGQPIGSMNFPLETVLSKKTKVIEYDLTVPTQAEAGVYVSKSIGVGFDESGKKIETGQASSSFTVRLKQLGIVGEVQAAEEVKGAETVAQPPCVAKKDYLPYILIAALLVLWFVEFMRRQRLEKELDEFKRLEKE